MKYFFLKSNCFHTVTMHVKVCDILLPEMGLKAVRRVELVSDPTVLGIKFNKELGGEKMKWNGTQLFNSLIPCPLLLLYPVAGVCTLHML